MVALCPHVPVVPRGSPGPRGARGKQAAFPHVQPSDVRSPDVPCSSPRPPQDISLEEFDDEDLSEITDDCGIGLNYDSDHYEKVHEPRVPRRLRQG